jgi:type I restriction enzyme R subunit
MIAYSATIFSAKAVESNFKHLEDIEPQLARLGELAERLFHADAPSSIGKTRSFAELLGKEVAARAGIEVATRSTFDDVLRILRDDGVLPRDAGELFHFIRRVGNAAVHENAGSAGDALTALKSAWQLSTWFRRGFLGEPKFQPGPFQPPHPPVDATVELRAEIEKLRETVRKSESTSDRAQREAREADTARATAEERANREAADRAAAEELLAEVNAAHRRTELRIAELQQAAARAPAVKLATFVTAAGQAAEAIEIDEADTRRLIDARLREAGWTADSDAIRYSIGSRPSLADAVAIAEWPTDNGPVDYALFLKGRCVGVIEAKRKSKDVPAVLEQAKRYARDIKLQLDELFPGAPYQHGAEKPYRVPLAFATNGRAFVKQLATKSGIWIWDTRKATHRPSALPEWFSPRDIEERLQQDAEAAEALVAETFSYSGLRPYQQDAVRAVEAAMDAGQKDILVAMATGTGKTRTCIVLMYRLLKHKVFRRVLFLVDRNALGEQTLQALDNTELEGLLKFASTYNVADLDKKLPDKEDRVHVATVQSMVKRILRPDENAGRPSPGMYDLIIVDEAHRGYVLDAEMREGDIAFRNLEDFLSQYRRVLDYFDATRVALTATPALHTTEIFGRPVYSYGYRQAVVDGFLIDHQPPRRITTALSKAGIHFEGGAEVQIIDPKSGQIDLFTTPDVVDFEVQEFNKKVYTVAFNRIVAEVIATEVPPDKPGKTLLFAARNDHADILVEELRTALENAYGAQPHNIVQKITGSVDDPGDKIRRFRNDPHPKYAVTVDLLTTGVDIPEICTLVFVRRVNSRILYDQMIGRATRRADHIGKEVFRIFDAVDIYANLQSVTDMRPVIVDPTITLSGLIQDLGRAEDPEDRAFVRDQIVVKVRQLLRHVSAEAAMTIADMTEIPPDKLTAKLQTMSPAEIVKLFTAKPRLAGVLDGLRPIRKDDPGIFISEHEDALISVDDVFEGVSSPEDYITAFERFVRENVNLVPALAAATQRPRELTRKDLKTLAAVLDEKGYSEAKLRRAYGRARNADIAAHIIGFVRQAALGDPLVPYATRVDNALARMKAAKPWTPKQRQWLDRIGRALNEQPVGDASILDEPAFASKGGFETVDRDFDHGLGPLLHDFNEAIWGGQRAAS